LQNECNLLRVRFGPQGSLAHFHVLCFLIGRILQARLGELAFET
jgi:hypothetical protein